MTDGAQLAQPSQALVSSRAGRAADSFRLMRYFTITTLIAFVAVALVLYFLERMEGTFFAQVQREQGAFLARAQAQLASQHQAAALSSLMAVHEASHVNLTRVVANMLWEKDFAPLLASAQRLDVDHCRALPAASLAPGAAAPASSPSPRAACYAALGRQIMAMPQFGALDSNAYAAMRSSTVFKIKVFDLRGITIYSSEHAQIGEDAVDNPGWQAASQGRPASELTHRDRFSAFERVVENRDLISTYVPVRAARSGELVGVFEIYADVTPFLGQIQAASRHFAEITAANESAVARVAAVNQEKVHASSERFLLIVGGLLGLLYAASLAIVRIGQRIIDRQALAFEQSAQREQQWHREKMAALATMAANVSHEVGNPLAIISGVAEGLAEHEADGHGTPGGARQLLEQTARIAHMTRQLADFAAMRSELPEWVDVNAMTKAVCDFLSFDRRFRGTPIEFRPGQQLPACEVVPDHLTEVLMSLLQIWAEGCHDLGHGERVEVKTEARGDGVSIRLGCAATSARARASAGAVARLESVRRRIGEMGAKLSLTATTVEIELLRSRDPALPH